MATDFVPSQELCHQLDELLLQNFGNKFTISRDSKGNYYFHLANGHIHCVHGKHNDEHKKRNKRMG